jgi:cytochrome P450
MKRNRMAGADSTSIAMRAIFYYLMKNPAKLDKLREEVDQAFESGALSHPVQYSDALKLTYLTAVIKEAGRLFPSFQSTMPRYAPPGGLVVCGKYIPGGYKLGMNPYIVQRDKDVFGEDSEHFRPERWLESDERNRRMEKSMLIFGAGTRQCIGRPVS